MTATTPPNKTLSRTRDHQVGLPARRAAASVLEAVLQKRQPLDDVLGRVRDGAMFDLPPRDRALARAIVGTSLRRKGQIDRVLETFLDRGLPARAGTLYPILLSGAAQILFMSVPPHAAIDLAVRLAQWDPRAKRYDKLVNAVLRRVSEKGAGIAEALNAGRVNTPDWLWNRWVRAWGEDRAEAIADAQLVEPPLDLTVKSGADAWAEQLGGQVLPTGSVRLLPKGRIEELPGFSEGAWWVQDAAASIPARLLHGIAGKRIADLCAAPGGKTAQLAAAGAAVTAVDLSKTRLARLNENLARLSLPAETVQANATAWQPDEPFDAILLDAPCSATGTIRRHPDVAYLKSDADIAELTGLQARLLDNAVRMLKPGGTLVYSTCSLEPEEGEAQIAALLARNDSLRIEPLRADEPFGGTDWAQASGVLRTFPDQLRLTSPEWSGMDGFFAARLARSG
ncbi:16S rRNA (cytosine(967)-C(5))-methyltransferase RsmB [Methyloceanibacter sp.]|uniref:16S rRNA (cytosine(967)-C(5))-methyltransferase RsmB n=1 Tax=Methyloceanibacter sp. TaxID=1965321 RepID=UPI002C93C7D3|nr:16S rRNA (cytosine(967)-C(5))-methyltransferase RsmB [Methyloceanibacter sp.]HML91557.1 16S rRNA (cytosine(967)-C(5))-methyltransferase RsmB [Methyloceanibacter sp.]